MEEGFKADKIRLPGEPDLSMARQLAESARNRIKSLALTVFENRKLRKVVRISAVSLASAASVIAVLASFLYLVPYVIEKIPVQSPAITNNETVKKDAAYRSQVSLLNRDIQRLSKKYNSYTSGQSYIVINTTGNRFMLYRNRKLVREGSCSSGSYTMLRTAEGDRRWIFRTPKGKYRILGKTVNPVWHKPDWAFVEEGLPVPPVNHSSRYETGVLGDYALAIGDGYLIHGTIYQRLLGMPVTHGCVRLNDDDLEVVFKTLGLGSKVYIF